MSLQVWLPLNGDLHNQGLSNITLTSNGTPSVDNNGKIGKCYSFNGSSYFQSNETFLNNMTACSLSCWVKDTYTGTSWMRIFGIGEHTRVHLDTNGSGQVRFFVSKNGTTGTYWGPISKTNIKDSTWHHVCGTFDNHFCKIYIDGKCETSVATNALSTVTGGKLYLGHVRDGIKLNGALNDVRIYDHCLSVKEVEEISKGLVLHYKLNQTALTKYDKNLYVEPDGSHWLHVVHHNNPVGGLFSKTDSWEIGVKKDDNRWYDFACVNLLNNFEFMVKQKAKSTDSEVKYRWIQTKNPLNAVYDDVKPASVTRITTTGYTDGAQGGLWKMNTSARLCIANTNSGNWYGALGSWTAYQNGIPGYPNTTITSGYIDLYVRIDELLSIVYDSSGYNNNGTIVGTLEVITPSPRYSYATKFDGSSSTIKVLENKWMAQHATEMTINIWVKNSSWSNGANMKFFSCTESGGFNCETGNSGYIRFPIYVCTNAEQTTYAYKYDSKEMQASALTANNWNMVTFVYNSTGTKTYINGQLHHTYTNTSYGIHFNTNARLFLGCEANTANPSSPYYNGQMSDFRLYYTALTAEQVKDLYKDSLIVNGTTKIPRDLE